MELTNETKLRMALYELVHHSYPPQNGGDSEVYLSLHGKHVEAIRSALDLLCIDGGYDPQPTK